MRQKNPIMFAIRLKLHTWARVFVNDLPLYKGDLVGPDSVSGPLNKLLVPGENELTIELLKVRQCEDYMDKEAYMNKVLEVEIYELLNPDEQSETAPIERRMIHEVHYPKMLDNADEARHRRVPFYYKKTFDPGIDLPAPPFMASPEEEFGCEGTDELIDEVRQIHQSLQKRDHDRFLELLELKFIHGERSLPEEVAQLAVEKRALFRRELLAYDPMPEPLDVGELHFEPRRNGQVALVTRKDGGFALMAQCQKDPKRRIKTDLLLTKREGRWRVFA